MDGIKALIKGVLLTVLALCIFMETGYAAGEYLQTDKGIKVWNLDPGPGISGVWNGSADASGFAAGEGTLKLFKNGNLYVVYEGRMLRGKLDGNGKIEYTKGGKYECSFVNGACTGKGILIFANGSRYEGDLVNFEPSGVFSQAKIRKKSCKNPKFIFRKSEKNHKSFLPHEGMFHSVTFPLK